MTISEQWLSRIPIVLYSDMKQCQRAMFTWRTRICDSGRFYVEEETFWYHLSFHSVEKKEKRRTDEKVEIFYYLIEMMAIAIFRIK